MTVADGLDPLTVGDVVSGTLTETIEPVSLARAFAASTASELDAEESTPRLRIA